MEREQQHTSCLRWIVIPIVSAAHEDRIPPKKDPRKDTDMLVTMTVIMPMSTIADMTCY